jgi:hypothetical protein
MRRYIGLFVFAAILGGMPSFLLAQPAFPSRGIEIVNELYAGVNPQDDTARKLAIHRTCSQMVFELGASWGNKKRAGLSDEFRSPDSIAYLEADGSVSVWDVQTSSGAITVFAGKPPDYPKLPPSEAAFMACAPMNYLNPPPPVPVPPVPSPVPSPTPVPVLDLSGLERQIAALDAKLTAHAAIEEAHWQAAKGIWESFFKPVLTFTSKYILPAVGGWLIGAEVAK